MENKNQFESGEIREILNCHAHDEQLENISLLSYGVYDNTLEIEFTYTENNEVIEDMIYLDIKYY